MNHGGHIPIETSGVCEERDVGSSSVSAFTVTTTDLVDIPRTREVTIEFGNLLGGDAWAAPTFPVVLRAAENDVRSCTRGNTF